MNTKRTQTQENAVLEHLKQQKSITPIEALQQYGCFRLASIIHKLKKKGYEIQTEIIKQDEKNFAKYKLHGQMPLFS